MLDFVMLMVVFKEQVMIQCTLLIFNETHMIRKDFSDISHLGAIPVVIFVFVVVIVLSF